jgi:hypothetical protein
VADLQGDPVGSPWAAAEKVQKQACCPCATATTPCGATVHT